MRKLAIAIGAILIPGVAAAHPEHASAGNFGFAHYLSEPFHVALAGAAILLIVVVRRLLLERHPVRVWVRGPRR